MGPTRIQSPVRGIWSFMNPPGHHPDAKDFVAVDEKGAPYKRIKMVSHLFFTLSVTETFSWEKEIFSPFDGTVIKVENNRQDRMNLNIFRDLVNGLIIAPKHGENNIEYFLGNHVVLKSNEGLLALFAHLRYKSIAVNTGMKVNTGEFIAKIGNSGNTIQPHLHFQLMNENDLSRAVPIPFVLESCQVSSNGGWESLNAKLPRNYQKFRV